MNSIEKFLLDQRESIHAEFRDASTTCLIATTAERLMRHSQEYSWSVASLNGIRPTSALVIQKSNSTPELWVRASYGDYAKAFRQFLKQQWGIQFAEIPSSLQIDHLHPKSRFTSQNDGYFVRLALIDRSINASFGAGFEKLLYQRERDRELVGGVTMDWMAYLKVMGIRVPSKTGGVDSWTTWAWQCAKSLGQNGLKVVAGNYHGLTTMLNLAYDNIWKPLPPHASFRRELEADPAFRSFFPDLMRKNLHGMNGDEPETSSVDYEIEESTSGGAFMGFAPGSDMGPADPDIEGAYRRGYHQAVAELASLLQLGEEVTASMLNTWVEEAGMRWRKDPRLDRKFVPPSIKHNEA
jgi:hypothetical protein